MAMAIVYGREQVATASRQIEDHGRMKYHSLIKDFSLMEKEYKWILQMSTAGMM